MGRDDNVREFDFAPRGEGVSIFLFEVDDNFQFGVLTLGFDDVNNQGVMGLRAGGLKASKGNSMTEDVGRDEGCPGE